jgi:predicted PhzF superfamily epimerase YddE/YHI9
MFCPLIGIDEDAGSGNATGLVAFLLEKNGAITSEGNNRFVSHQGAGMGRACSIEVKLERGSAIVSGTACIVFQGTLDTTKFGK